MKKNQKLLGLVLVLILLAGLGLAQRTAREMPSHSYGSDGRVLGTPEWTNAAGFPKDVFTFVRLKYSVNGEHGFGHTRPDERWLIDAPDSDLNFSFRLQQMTSIKVNPNGLFLEITDKELFDYPFVYIVEPGRLTFTDEEVPILRKYLLNGGFLMFDDFWGQREWLGFYTEIKRVFPDREIVDVPLDHAIFHCVFDLPKKPQIPGLPHVKGREGSEVTWEPRAADTTVREPQYRAIYDDKNRMMVLICHNTDLGDGWEREGENEYYFREYSEKQAFPLGINIVFYVMTH